MTALEIVPPAAEPVAAEAVLLPPRTPVTAAPSHDMADLSAVRDEYRSRQRSESTMRAYRSDLADYGRWCRRHNVRPLPVDPDDLASYAAWLAAERGLALSTIQRRLSAVSSAHTRAGHPSPRSAGPVVETLSGIARTHGAAQRKAEPARWPTLVAMVAANAGDGLKASRDRAILLVGFAGAFRRSELVGLNVADLKFALEGVRVTIRKSKTDQVAAGRQVAIPYAPEGQPCPVTALRDWLTAAGITAGPVFRAVDKHGHVRARRLGARAVSEIVKASAAAVGLDPREYSGHSLRAGHITSAAAAGASGLRIAGTSGHKSQDVLGGYVRLGQAFASASFTAAVDDQ